jgi:hypothetical protein
MLCFTSYTYFLCDEPFVKNLIKWVFVHIGSLGIHLMNNALQLIYATTNDGRTFLAPPTFNHPQPTLSKRSFPPLKPVQPEGPLIYRPMISTELMTHPKWTSLSDRWEVRGRRDHAMLRWMRDGCSMERKRLYLNAEMSLLDTSIVKSELTQSYKVRREQTSIFIFILLRSKYFLEHFVFKHL